MVSKTNRKWTQIRGYFNLHIDLPTIVVILLIVLLIYQPLFNELFDFIGFIGSKTESPKWLNDIFIGIVSNIISAFIVVPTVFWMFQLQAKAALCGKFKTYEIVDGNENYWGDVELTYNIFSNRIHGRASSNEYDSDVQIEAVFERGEYLRGHYVEKKKSTRRRMGAFLLMLDGEGSSYSGPYVYVDPKDSNYHPKEGQVRWIAEQK